MGVLCVGLVLRPVGLKGELRVKVSLPWPSSPCEGLWLSSPKFEEKYPLTAWRSHTQDYVVVHAQGIDSCEEAELFRGCDVLSLGENFPLKEDEYWVSKLVGMSAIDNEDKTKVGIVESIDPSSSTDILKIRLFDNRLLLLPFVDEFVPVVSPSSQEIELKLWKAFLDSPVDSSS